MNFLKGLSRNQADVYVIAEAGVNHNGSMALARKHVDAAKAAGADAVKFQTFITEVNQSCVHLPKDYLTWAKSLEFSFDQFRDLAGYCRRAGIQFLSTPFEVKSAAFLNDLVPLFKISSGEITNLPLLMLVAGFGKPIVLSTGMSNDADIAMALKVINKAWPKKVRPNALTSTYSYFKEPVVLLHCVSQYPTAFKDENLLVMHSLYKRFGVPVGLSDHTLGIEAPLAAVALGACVIEKHFTIDKKLPGPDHALSLDPGELKAMITGIKNVRVALGDGKRALSDGERKLIKIARKSLVAAYDIRKGSIITPAMTYVMRPGTGIAPKDLSLVVGKRLLKDMRKDQMFALKDLK